MRGTTNSNRRGSSYARKRRKLWLLKAFEADINGPICRCYRCGVPLTFNTLTVDRIVPGCKGGTYARTNIRPACGACNSETGGRTRG